MNAERSRVPGAWRRCGDYASGFMVSGSNSTTETSSMSPGAMPHCSAWAFQAVTASAELSTSNQSTNGSRTDVSTDRAVRRNNFDCMGQVVHNVQSCAKKKLRPETGAEAPAPCN